MHAQAASSPVVEAQRSRANPPDRIVVTKLGEVVFEEKSGKYGFQDSVLRDYTCFASPIIGAAYHYLSYEDSAKIIADKGYRTTFFQADDEWSVEVTPRGERYLKHYP